jgi:fatty acid desaturase
MKGLVDSKWLRERARVHPWRNLLFLGLDHLCIAVLVASAIAFDLWRRVEEWPWIASAPVWLPVALLIGVLQHRIGLMGHEASHYLLHPNRRWNDLLADWLCFFPVFGSLANYRAKHLDHHLHPNDPEKDPNFEGGKFERFYALFPMARRSFVIRYGLGFFWPPFVLSNLLDLLRVITLGGGAAARAQQHRGGGAPSGEKETSPLLAGRLGVAYILALAILLRAANLTGFSVWTTLLVSYAAGVIGWKLLPSTAFAARKNAPIDPKWTALFRMTVYSAFFGTTALVLHHTGYQCFPAFFILWVFPLVYVFPYLMLVREIFQHANAGTGELDNSRIMKVSPWIRWALLGYGNDYHLVHHLYPNIPCYRLAEVHEHLSREAPGYRRTVTETHGLGSRTGDPGSRSLMDCLAEPSEARPTGSAG